MNKNNNYTNYTQNRELSWLRFNHRVLLEASSKDVPILERLKFISIFMSNFDEFFMIRVGSLLDLLAMKSEIIDSRSGMNVKEQLKAIYVKSEELFNLKDEVYNNIQEELKACSIYDLEYDELDEKERKTVKNYFKNEVMPILSPQIVSPLHPFPHLNNKSLYIANILKHKKEEVLGLIPIPASLPSVLFLSEKSQAIKYTRIENILAKFAYKCFSNYEVQETSIIRVTRNADLNFDDENFNFDNDFRKKVKKLLSKRKRLAPVRLEMSSNYACSKKINEKLENYLQEKLSLSNRQVFHIKTPMQLDFAFSLQSKLLPHIQKNCIYQHFNPVYPIAESELLQNKSIIEYVQKKDLLLSLPFENMKPFLNLLKESSNDDSVISIKMTIYRLDEKSKIIEYLSQAAENGKDVTVLIELRARFDEQNNIGWSERLEEAGCNIIYGFENYKVHSKVCLITKREDGEIKYISQVGTGNYNEKTSKLYTDVSLLTYNQNIGKDLSDFFQNMAVSNLNGVYNNILVAPVSLKPTLIKLINEESQKGKDGNIIIKINSITDIDIIRELRNASCAGVKITLIVRGICCVIPNIPNETENIKIINIVGRFLEHTRVYIFGSDKASEPQKMYISSADLMTRNTEKRVEVACPIYSENIRSQINFIIEASLKDNVKASILQSNAEYLKKEPKKGEELFDSQQALIDKALKINL